MGLELAEIAPRALGARAEIGARAERRAVLGAQAIELSQRRRLDRLARLVLQDHGAIHHLLDVAPHHDDAVAAHEAGARVPDHAGDGPALLDRLDQLRLAVDRHAVGEDAALERDRPERALRDGEQRRIRRMQMGDGERVVALAMQDGMDRPFDGKPHVAVENLAVEIGGQDVVGLHGRFLDPHAGRHVDPPARGIIGADVAEQADQLLHGEDAGAGGELVAQNGFVAHGFSRL